jgi:plasmid stabilization system protein ParE
MKYTVFITDPAQEEFDEAYAWLVERTPLHAPRWHAGLLEAIHSLETSPARCPIAPGSEAAHVPTRQLLYGSKQHAYRILFTIRNETVIVLHIIHGARDTAY